MAALPNTQLVFHRYHAKAHLLSASLAQPVEREVEAQAEVSIDQESNGKRVYEYQAAKSYQVEGIISYQSGYTQVAGHKSPKASHGFVTLATSVMEGLNILDVVTADRVVGQISTEHPLYGTGQVPSVTFLGTRFVNLRIGGQKVEAEPDLHIVGPKPDDDRSFFKDQGFVSRIARQFHNISGAVDAPDWARDEYSWNPSTIQSQNEARCSLVSRVTGLPEGSSFGHVIDLPHFGRIFLGELIVNRTAAKKPDENDTYRFNLSMVRVEMGCLAQGTATAVALDANGSGGHH
jgi:hypothetical protein